MIAYELLLGRPPFVGAAREVLLGHLGGEPPSPEALGTPLPRSVWEALRRPLAKDPSARPATAAELVGALVRAARDLARARFDARFRARKKVLLATGVALLGLAALALPRGIPPLERRLHDWRLAAAPSRPPDPRILLVTLDQAALDGLRSGKVPVPLGAPAWGDEMASRLSAVLAAGARGVAIDLVLGEGWSASERFSHFLLSHEGKVVLGAELAGGHIYGGEVARGLTAAVLGERASGLFGYVDVEEEGDGVVRHARGVFVTDDGTFPSWAARAAALLGRDPAPLPPAFPLDGRIDWKRYSQLTWGELGRKLRQDPGSLSGKLVLVGTDQGDDLHQVPGRSGGPEEIRGVALQALATDTIARDLPVREAPAAPFLLGALALTGVLAGRILAPDSAAAWRAAVPLALALLGWAALSFVLFRQSGVLVPTSGPLALTALGGALAIAARPLLLRTVKEPSS